MPEFEWQTRRQRIDIKARGQVDAPTPSLPPSPGYGGTGLVRAWAHSLPARSGGALSLREMDSLMPTRSALRALVQYVGTNSFHRHPGASSLFTRSQRVQIAGQLVSPRHYRRTGGEVAGAEDSTRCEDSQSIKPRI